MKYESAPDLQKLAEEISAVLFPYIKIDRVKCFRSFGSSSKRTIARCHALGKLMQQALEVEAFYPIEFLSERFNKLNFEEQIKVIIHELMHIPKAFGGGFRHHNLVTKKNVKLMYKKFISLR
jgi:predicted metallopeptidase